MQWTVKLSLKKLSHYRIKNTELKLFCSYRNNRWQCYKVNREPSNTEYIRCGVPPPPQGLYLGPLSFPLYINDMPYALKCSKITMYADNTGLACSTNNVGDISDVMNYEL